MVGASQPRQAVEGYTTIMTPNEFFDMIPASKLRRISPPTWHQPTPSLYVLGIPTTPRQSLPGAPSAKVVAFDLDSTLAIPRSGKFASGADDWVLINEAPMRAKLLELHDSGAQLVIMSNQGGVGKGKTSPASVMGRIDNVINALGVPMAAMFATADDHYRKPGTGMWTHYSQHIDVAPDLASSVYVGDAAGRAKNWVGGKPKDFSCSDRKFAVNCGLSFATPEEFFLNMTPAPFQWGGFDPASIPHNLPLVAEGKPLIPTGSQLDMVVIVGPPGSGKSTFSRSHLPTYEHVNRDTLKTPEKCLQVAKQALSQGKCVVVDNTNPQRAKRQPYIAAAKKAGATVRALRFNVDIEFAKHMNMFRERVSQGESRHVPDVGYNMYKKNLEEPSLAEGFDEILHINFVPHFETEAARLMFAMWQT